MKTEKLAAVAPPPPVPCPTVYTSLSMQPGFRMGMSVHADSVSDLSISKLTEVFYWCLKTFCCCMALSKLYHSSKTTGGYIHLQVIFTYSLHKSASNRHSPITNVYFFTHCLRYDLSMIRLTCWTGSIKTYLCVTVCRSIVLLFRLDQGKSGQNRDLT